MHNEDVGTLADKFSLLRNCKRKLDGLMYKMFDIKDI